MLQFTWKIFIQSS